MGQRIVLLADSASSHTEKWATALASKGYTIGLFSLNKSGSRWYKKHKNIYLLNEPEQFVNTDFILNKLNYVFALPRLREAIKKFRPDILHAHYASSYGLLGAMSNFRPFILSVWGSDVFEFPKKSFLHKLILKFNLRKADRILSTSYAMKGELWSYTRREVLVIPFGVDLKLFSPENVRTRQQKQTITIGAIKSIEDKYGIKTIIEAARLVKLCLQKKNFKFYLIGSGSKTNYYKKLVSTLGLNDMITFTGKIPFSEISDYHNFLDIFLNVPTVNESFGVSVIEAMACEKPVIVTNAPGLKEIVNDKTGIIVHKGNAQELARAIIRLIESPELRKEMGKRGRRHVKANYDFDSCFDQLTGVYNSVTLPEKILSPNTNYQLGSYQI